MVPLRRKMVIILNGRDMQVEKRKKELLAVYLPYPCLGSSALKGLSQNILGELVEDWTRPETQNEPII